MVRIPKHPDEVFKRPPVTNGTECIHSGKTYFVVSVPEIDHQVFYCWRSQFTEIRYGSPPFQAGRICRLFNLCYHDNSSPSF
jgi:hypothetical protein